MTGALEHLMGCRRRPPPPSSFGRTDLGLLGVFSGSGVPDGVHVQDLHLLEENQASAVAQRVRLVELNNPPEKQKPNVSRRPWDDAGRGILFEQAAAEMLTGQKKKNCFGKSGGG